MSLSGAASAMGLPEALVERSAAARAAESGASVDEILAAWAGGEAPPAGEPQAEPEPEQVEDAAEEAAEEPVEETAPPPPVIETPEPAAAPAAASAPTRAPIPAEVTAAEAANLAEVVTVPTAGIKERPNFVIPRWLIALMLVAPLFALFALGGSSTGACGEATELDVDVISGELINCDGSEFTGVGAGGGGADLIALGGDIYSGSAVTGVNCASCHGANGQGGVGPAFGGVITTFGSCTDHIEWVSIGSDNWPDATYGDTGKTPGAIGTMPGFGGTLSEEQLAAVAAFERVRFGGADPDETLVDCGIAEPEGEGGGETPEDGEAPDGEDGGAPAGTTVPAEASSAG